MLRYVILQYRYSNRIWTDLVTGYEMKNKMETKKDFSMWGMREMWALHGRDFFGVVIVSDNILNKSGEHQSSVSDYEVQLKKVVLEQTLRDRPLQDEQSAGCSNGLWSKQSPRHVYISTASEMFVLSNLMNITCNLGKDAGDYLAKIEMSVNKLGVMGLPPGKERVAVVSHAS